MSLYVHRDHTDYHRTDTSLSTTQLQSVFFKCCFTASAETVRTIRDGEPRTATSSFILLLSSVSLLFSWYVLYRLWEHHGCVLRWLWGLTYTETTCGLLGTEIGYLWTYRVRRPKGPDPQRPKRLSATTRTWCLKVVGTSPVRSNLCHSANCSFNSHAEQLEITDEDRVRTTHC